MDCGFAKNSPNPLDGTTPSTPSEYRPIAFPLAGQIQEDLVERLPAGKDGQDLLQAARATFAQLQPADVLVLAANDDTTADKFLVPVREDAVSGAWVHAAVALTEYGVAAPDTHHGVARYLRQVANDVVIALGFAILTDCLLACGRHWQTGLRDCWNAMIPAAVLLVTCALALWLSWRDFRVDGTWDSPLLLLVGMQLHAYLHLSHAHSHPTGHVSVIGAVRSHVGPAHVKRHRFRLSSTQWLQWGWATAIFFSALTGMWPHAPVLPLIGAGTLGGLLYVLACRVVAWLPLPWRSRDENLAS